MAVDRRGALLATVLFACTIAAIACVRDRDSSFDLRLRRGASCTDVNISCARVLNVALDHADPRSWKIAITGTGAGARFGDLDLPTSGTGRFFVVGSSLGFGPVFAGSSQLVTFDAKDASALVTFECVLPPPCPIFSLPIETPTPFAPAADLVLGKNDFTTCDNGANAGNETVELREPDGLERAGGHLWVADADFNRGAVWSTAGLVSGKAIDFVVQQDNRTSTGDADGDNDTRLPRDLLLAPALPLRLIVDTGLGDNSRGNRIGRNTTIPTTDATQPNNAAYETVFGQDDPAGGNTNVNDGGLGAGSLFSPWSAVLIGTNVWVADTGNHRVLRYALADLATNRPLANLVLGQPDFTTAAPAAGAGMSAPRHLATDGTRLYVADSGNHRVLVFDDLDGLANGAPASVVIGQTTLGGNAPGSGASGLNGPRGVAADGTRVVIADSDNHRVLVFAPPPVANGAEAIQVLGQPDFDGTTPNQGGGNGTCPNIATCGTVGETTLPTDSNLARPGAVFVEGGTLWVSDTCNSRVLRFREPGG